MPHRLVVASAHSSTTCYAVLSYAALDVLHVKLYYWFNLYMNKAQLSLSYITSLAKLTNFNQCRGLSSLTLSLRCIPRKLTNFTHIKIKPVKIPKPHPSQRRGATLSKRNFIIFASANLLLQERRTVALACN